jgi:hypothetical protein
MKRTSLYLVFAGLLSLAGPATARADLVLTLTPFTGTNTDYTTAVSAETFLPYTDMYGRTVSADAIGDGVSRISPGSGIFQVQPPMTPFTLTFSGLAPGTTQAGFSNVNAGAQLVSAMVDNGDSYSTPISSSSDTITFFGFTDTTPFTSITLTFSGAESFNILDFVTATATSAVPEPSSLTISGGVVAACAAAASWRRRRAQRGDRDR